MSKKIAQIGVQCVACGSCIKVCPLHAISVPFGVTAIVDAAKCVGCGKCATVCPASVISLLADKSTSTSTSKNPDESAFVEKKVRVV